jgi:hypothetical protein
MGTGDGHSDSDYSESSLADVESEGDGFIVEDDPTIPVAELPTQFQTLQDPAYHFKTICQLFVHLAVRGPHNRRDFMKESLRSEPSCPDLQSFFG